MGLHCSKTDAQHTDDHLKRSPPPVHLPMITYECVNRRDKPLFFLSSPNPLSDASTSCTSSDCCCLSDTRSSVLCPVDTSPGPYDSFIFDEWRKFSSLDLSAQNTKGNRTTAQPRGLVSAKRNMSPDVSFDYVRKLFSNGAVTVHEAEFKSGASSIRYFNERGTESSGSFVETRRSFSQYDYNYYE